MNYHSKSADELRATQEDLRKLYDALCAAGLTLDLTRGKPAPEQLDLSNELLSLPGADFRAADGTDTRNYGGLRGLPELREIFGGIFAVDPVNLIAYGNASLEIMHHLTTFGLLRGTVDSAQPWSSGPVKFLCPVPGYDRHFAITEQYGIEMVPVPMNPDGPDVDACAALTAADPSIKGMWAVPTYSNPTGVTFSAEVTEGLLSMPAADDFRVYWDNAYAVHTLVDEAPTRRLAEHLEAERVAFVAATETEDFREGVAAFLAKRSPIFRGR